MKLRMPVIYYKEDNSTLQTFRESISNFRFVHLFFKHLLNIYYRNGIIFWGTSRWLWVAVVTTMVFRMYQVGRGGGGVEYVGHGDDRAGTTEVSCRQWWLRIHQMRKEYAPLFFVLTSKHTYSVSSQFQARQCENNSARFFKFYLCLAWLSWCVVSISYIQCHICLHICNQYHRRMIFGLMSVFDSK